MSGQVVNSKAQQKRVYGAKADRRADKIGLERDTEREAECTARDCQLQGQVRMPEEAAYASMGTNRVSSFSRVV